MMSAPRPHPAGRGRLATRVQHKLSALYGLEAPPIAPFLRAVDGEREQVQFRTDGETLEIAVRLPKHLLDESADLSMDLWCQLIEGVSHFLHLVERARRELPTTQLELELQAEVDKFVLLAGGIERANGSFGARCRRIEKLFTELYEKMEFLHPPSSERGHRYRVANDLAARFAHKHLVPLAAEGRLAQAKPKLRDFFGAGQREKIEMALAA